MRLLTTLLTVFLLVSSAAPAQGPSPAPVKTTTTAPTPAPTTAKPATTVPAAKTDTTPAPPAKTTDAPASAAPALADKPAGNDKSDAPVAPVAKPAVEKPAANTKNTEKSDKTTPETTTPAFSENDATVSLLQVEATGKDGADAKNQAIKQGIHEAFKQLIPKLYPNNVSDILPKTSSEQMEGLVQSQHIESEKTEGNHYIGVLTFVFNPKKLAALAKADIPVVIAPEATETAINTHSILIIPILKYNEVSKLWEDENTWRKSWNRVTLQIGRGELIAPFGDRRDREEIGPEEGAGGTFKDFAPIAERYGVKEIYVVTAEYQSTDLSLGVVIQIRKISEAGITNETLPKFDSEERETREQQLDRVALLVARRLTKAKGTATDTTQGLRDNEITLDVTYGGLGELQTINAKLEAIPSVRRIVVNNLSYDSSRITLYYRTNPDQLSKSFAAQGFKIYKKGDSLTLTLPQ